MVTIKNYKTITKDDGEKFYALILEGGIEPVLISFYFDLIWLLNKKKSLQMEAL